jgi:N-acetylglutamate synthase-like GNAT family acetyltransferase
MRIVEHNKDYENEVIDLIVNIQRDEFGIKITAADQPDLKKVREVYQQGNGNFWVAVEESKPVGTIALVDIGKYRGALRKMFVHPSSRGKNKGVAQNLLDTLLAWCRLKGIHTVYLGTIDVMKAAHRFYEKNGFVEIKKEQLPEDFPVMKVDNVFYKYSFTN